MVKQTPSSTSLRVVVLVVAFHLAVISATSLVPLWIHDCDNANGNHTSNIPHKENLDYLLIDMMTTISGSGLYNSPLGHTPDVIYLKSLCIGDLPVSDCRECLASLTDQIINHFCPNQIHILVQQVKSAVYWANKCMIRYSSISMFGIMDTDPYIVAVGEATIGLSEEKRYNHVVQGMLADFPRSVSNGNSSLKFSTREADFNSSITIYSAAQCTPNLAPVDCLRCLTTAVNMLESKASSRRGARICFPSCNVRYEEEKFYPSSTKHLP